MKTILATTYAVNPYNGSEDGMGWNYVMQIASNQKVIAITRENNRMAIEEYMRENPDPVYENIRFEYFDLPYWMRFWKRKSRGALLYFLLWQAAIPSFVKKKNLLFDIAHNLNFHNDWSPSFLWKLNKPFVWGPIGHHPAIPKQFRKRLSTKEKVRDTLTWLVKKYFWTLSPSLKKTVSKAEHIWCMNTSVPTVINLADKNYGIEPSVAADDPGETNIWKSRHGFFHLISAGRFVPLKGIDLTLAAYARFLQMLSDHQRQHVQLTLVGRGPEEPIYQKYIRDHQLEEYVHIIRWIKRDKLMNMFGRSDAFIFPSHEGAGMVVPEALSYGLPVICLDNYGPGEFVDSRSGVVVSGDSYQDTVEALAQAIYLLYSDPHKLEALKSGARKRFKEKFEWSVRGQHLNNIYNSIKS
ncbi:MAG: glycosyltransferase [Saprospiraceae bacterium]|nr:glycosyltransferase [Saprospiraceae bacterium]